ncbi:MAG: bifunctional hydroxymethylpyrimidine kinase/phosphomethylpyrimidine kinase [Alicyclobacillus sp.]|nr:bifunctional hydroxymethylpyrimidine kinase/phosphomethylpyrimidine kinase [Alicyclobacillus sp.]
MAMTTPAPRLVHVGNVVIDVVVNVEQIPTAGTDVIASGGMITPGGGFNVMVAAVRQGLPAVYGGRLGTGPFAGLARKALADAGISIACPAEGTSDQGFVVCMVDAPGERTFVTRPGAEATLELCHLTAIRLTPADVVYISGYSLMYPSNRDALLQWVPGLPAEVAVVFDPGPLVADIPAQALATVLARADWLTCNAREACLLTNLADPLTELNAAEFHAAEPEAAAVKLARMSARRNVVVRDGPAGCVLVEAGGTPRRIEGFSVRPVDTNGAGDAHTGAFLAALAQGKTPADAARWANASAALAVTRRGPATGPTQAEVEEWLAYQALRRDV